MATDASVSMGDCGGARGDALAAFSGGRNTAADEMDFGRSFLAFAVVVDSVVRPFRRGEEVSRGRIWRVRVMSRIKEDCGRNSMAFRRLGGLWPRALGAIEDGRNELKLIAAVPGGRRRMLTGQRQREITEAGVVTACLED